MTKKIVFGPITQVEAEMGYISVPDPVPNKPIDVFRLLKKLDSEQYTAYEKFKKRFTTVRSLYSK